MPKPRGGSRYDSARPRGGQGKRPKHTRFLVVSGGLETEKQYIDYVRKALNARGLTVDVKPKGVSPLRLVEHARDLQAEEKRQAKRQGDSSNVYDQVWVVTDVDRFQADLARAFELAAQTGIRLCVSNPCFEVWLVWHVADFGTHCEPRRIQAVAKKHDLVSGKGAKHLDPGKLTGKYAEARLRALAARSRFSDQGTASPNDNPSSGVDEFVESVLTAARKANPGRTMEL